MNERNTGPLFRLGRIIVTPGALAAIDETGALAADFINRHVRGDWGIVDSHDADINDEAVFRGHRIMSAYDLVTWDDFIPAQSRVSMWIITEADRSATSLLLPNEY
jgi:hypothetical protein